MYQSHNKILYNKEYIVHVYIILCLIKKYMYLNICSLQ